MCANKCYQDGSCTKVIPGAYVQPLSEGKVLLVPYGFNCKGRTKRVYTKMFLGDVSWKWLSLYAVEVTEYHAIDREIKGVLKNEPGAGLSWLTSEVRNRLFNDLIPTHAINNRLKSMQRHGLVDMSGHVTPEGLAQYEASLRFAKAA